MTILIICVLSMIILIVAFILYKIYVNTKKDIDKAISCNAGIYETIEYLNILCKKIWFIQSLLLFDLLCSLILAVFEFLLS